MIMQSPARYLLKPPTQCINVDPKLPSTSMQIYAVSAHENMYQYIDRKVYRYH